MRKHRRVQTVVTAALLFGAIEGCSDWYHQRPKALASDNPHDTDSLYVLVRKMLKDDDLSRTGFAFKCEVHEIFNRLGNDAVRRIDVAVDSALETTDDRDHWHAVSNRLAGSEFEASDSSCAPGGWERRMGYRAALPLRRD